MIIKFLDGLVCFVEKTYHNRTFKTTSTFCIIRNISMAGLMFAALQNWEASAERI